MLKAKTIFTILIECKFTQALCVCGCVGMRVRMCARVGVGLNIVFVWVCVGKKVCVFVCGELSVKRTKREAPRSKQTRRGVLYN